MPSLLERVRRVRQHDSTAISTPDAVAEHHPTSPSAYPPDATAASTVAAAGPVPAVPDLAAPNPAAEPDPAADSTAPEPQPGSTPAAPRVRIARTRISGAWVAAIIAVVALVFLLIFILQNLTSSHVYFLGATGTLPMGVALLFAAVGGALLIAAFGSARVLQLRRAAHRRHH